MERPVIPIVWMKKLRLRVCPGGPLVKTLHFQWMGHGFHPCQGIKFSQAEAKKRERKKLKLRWMRSLVQGHLALSGGARVGSQPDIHVQALHGHSPIPSNELSFHLVYTALSCSSGLSPTVAKKIRRKRSALGTVKVNADGPVL